MKPHTPAASTAAKKITPRNTTARTGTRQPAAKSLSLPLPAVPTVWQKAAADLNFPSVEEWASAMLDIMSWPGNRFTIPPGAEQMNRWCKAGRSKDMTMTDWVLHTLDAASEVEGGRP